MCGIEEEWGDIGGYEGLYQVSNLGRVRSLDRWNDSGKGPKFFKGRIMSLTPTKRGYRRVSFKTKGVKKSLQVHRLVALAFIDNPNGYDMVNHLDEDKINNKVSNLQWINNRANLNHSLNKRSTSKYPGVSWFERSRKWKVYCRINGKPKYLGTFTDEEEAAQAYVDFCKENNLVYKV